MLDKKIKSELKRQEHQEGERLGKQRAVVDATKALGRVPGSVNDQDKVAKDQGTGR